MTTTPSPKPTLTGGQIGLRLDAATFELVRRLAQRQRRTVTEMARLLIEDGLRHAPLGDESEEAAS